MNSKATDFLIECGNPEAFDRTVQQMGAALIQESDKTYLKKDGYYVMRVLSNPSFLEFAIKNQGYGKVIKKLDKLI